MDHRLYIVLLRRPKDKFDARTDPFWEFGSFGLTGCHKHNLLNPRESKRLENSQLAFVQGGDDGFKLLLITPPLQKIIVNDYVEVRWKPLLPPFKYSTAPLIINNEGKSNFGSVFDAIKKINRPTPISKFSSAYRSRATPIEEINTKRLIKLYNKFRSSANPDAFIKNYFETLPWPIPNLEKNRKRTYDNLKRNIQSQNCKPTSTCKPRSKCS